MNLDTTNFGYIHYWFDLLNITYSRFQKNQDFKRIKISKNLSLTNFANFGTWFVSSSCNLLIAQNSNDQKKFYVILGTKVCI